MYAMLPPNKKSSSNQADISSKIAVANDLYRRSEFSEALGLYRQLAEQNITSCKRFVGWMYLLGEGVQPDTEQALYWLKAAAEDDDAEALFAVGRVYTSLGDHEAAKQWYESAAKKEFPPAIYRLGRMFLHGHSVPKNVQKALDLFAQAAKKGHLKSGKDYAVLLIKGHQGLWGRVLGLLLLFKVIATTVIVAARNPNDPRFMF